MAATVLQAYLVKRVLEAQEEIAPELMEYIGGKDEGEIDASVALAKKNTAALVARAQQQQFRPDDFDGARFQASVSEGFGELPDIRAMTMDDYAVYRQQLGLAAR